MDAIPNPLLMLELKYSIMNCVGMATIKALEHYVH